MVGDEPTITGGISINQRGKNFPRLTVRKSISYCTYILNEGEISLVKYKYQN
nr:MAG TPA: hypothetical protein [Bacteriophage sp.]